MHFDCILAACLSCPLMIPFRLFTACASRHSQFFVRDRIHCEPLLARRACLSSLLSWWVLTTLPSPVCVYTEDHSHPSAAVTVPKPRHPLDPWSLCAPVQLWEVSPTITTLRPSLPSLPLPLPSNQPLLPHPSSFHTLPHPPTPILTMQLSHCPAISQHSAGRAHRGLLCVLGDGRRQYTVRAPEKRDVWS